MQSLLDSIFWCKFISSVFQCIDLGACPDSFLAVNGAEANSFGKKLQCINSSAQYIIDNFDLIFRPKFKFKSWKIARIAEIRAEKLLYIFVSEDHKKLFFNLLLSSSPNIAGQAIKLFVCLEEINSLVSLY